MFETALELLHVYNPKIVPFNYKTHETVGASFEYTQFSSILGVVHHHKPACTKMLHPTIILVDDIPVSPIFCQTTSPIVASSKHHSMSAQVIGLLKLQNE